MLAPNGKIYCANSNTFDILVIDTKDDSFYCLTTPYKGYQGAILGPDMKMYFVPYTATNITCINLLDESITYFGSFPNDGSHGNFIGGILAQNGCIYGIADYSTFFIKIGLNQPISENFVLSKYSNKL
jgi:hypothetical protein